jgi:hypothetical protein
VTGFSAKLFISNRFLNVWLAQPRHSTEKAHYYFDVQRRKILASPRIPTILSERKTTSLHLPALASAKGSHSQLKAPTNLICTCPHCGKAHIAAEILRLDRTVRSVRSAVRLSSQVRTPSCDGSHFLFMAIHRCLFDFPPVKRVRCQIRSRL